MAKNSYIGGIGFEPLLFNLTSFHVVTPKESLMDDVRSRERHLGGYFKVAMRDSKLPVI